MSRPPRWSDRLLRWLLPDDVAEEVGGDLQEEWSLRPAGPLRHLRHALSILSVTGHFLLREPPRLGWSQHLRLAVRRLRRQPTFSVVAVSAIALGIGVNATMLAIADEVLLAPLPYPEGERLAVLTNDHSGSSTGGFGVSYANIRDVRDRSNSVESIALYMDWQDISYEAADGAVRIPAAFVSDEYVEALGLTTVLGRFFADDENRENAAASVAVLGHGTWQSVFGGDPAVLGRTLILNGRPTEVVGVVGDDRGDLRYRWGEDPVGIYLPLFAAEAMVGFDLDGDRGGRFLNGVLRLEEDRTFDDARSELASISRELEAEFPRSNEGWTYDVQPLDEALFESLRTPTSAILGISVLVFVLVAVNLLTLVLLRASGRAEETAVRRALGAGRGRVLAQLLTETTVLAALGWGAGMMLGAWGLELFATSDAVRLPEFTTVALDPRVVVVSLGAAALLALVLGLAPGVSLLRSAGDNPSGFLKGSRGSADRGRVRVQTTLVGAEVALACVLLVGAGLLLESFWTLRSTGYGFDTERLVLARVDLRSADYSTDELLAVTSSLESSAEALPGAEDAFLWSPNRLGHGNQVEILTPEGRWNMAPEERLEASLHTVRPGTLQSLGIRLLSGREVSPSDDASGPRVAWVSESLARALWPGEEAVGRRIETVESGELATVEVAGIVSDARHRTRLIEPFEPQRDIYYPYAQHPRAILSVAIRHTEGADIQALADGVRKTVRELSPRSPVFGVTTMAQRMREEEGPARLGALLVGMYAALAMALAALGLYGVLAHGVQLQLREIGIRMAMGAQRSVLVRRVVARGMAMTGAGLVVGTVLAIPAIRLLRSAIYGDGSATALIYVSVMGSLALVALAACAIPASRAVRVAPTDVLRSE